MPINSFSNILRPFTIPLEVIAIADICRHKIIKYAQLRNTLKKVA